jgi:hypothetical protein
LLIALAAESSANDVVINEVELNPLGEDQGAEWVELYNGGRDPMDISGWVISSTRENVIIPSGTLIPPNGFYVVSSQKQWLDNNYESIILRDATGRLIDQTPPIIDQVDDNCAFTRAPDGDYSWREMQSSEGAPASFATCRCSPSQPDIDFRYSGVTEGNISTINVTPAGRTIKSYSSYISNIKVGSSRLHERTSALEGSYKSEDSKRFRYQQHELFDVALTSPLSNWRIRGLLEISSWGAHRAINYSGEWINDRDYSSSLFTNTSTQFLYNKNFTKNRDFQSARSYSLEANTTGLTDLQFKYRFLSQIGRDVPTSTDVVSEQRYYGNFNVTANPRQKFEFISDNSTILYITPCSELLNYTYCSQGWLDDFCGMPLCWEPSSYVIEVVEA